MGNLILLCHVHKDIVEIYTKKNSDFIVQHNEDIRCTKVVPKRLFIEFGLEVINLFSAPSAAKLV